MKLTGLALALALSAAAGSAWAADVTLTVTGVQPARGGMLYAAAQTRDQFMEPGQATAGDAVTPSGATAVFHLKNLPPGDYAISVLHDTNGNHRMDTAPNGVPLEGWAIPGHETLDHMPTFDEVKVTVPPDGVSLTARMVYMDGKIPGEP